MKLAFADAHTYITDPDYMRLPVPALLDPAYAAHRRSLISDIALDPISGDPMRRGGTVYLCAADIDGVMVSLIQSKYMGFGSHVVVPGTGFTLQNRGAGFSLDPTHPNHAAGRKRPFHTIIPAFLTRGGSPVGPFGVMGAHMQPQGHVQMVVNSVDRGLDPQAALGAPRWHWSQHRSLAIEPSVDPAIIDGLRQRGHEVTVAKDLILFGHGQAIWRLPDGDTSADPTHERTAAPPDTETRDRPLQQVGSNSGAGYAVQTAVNGGSEPLIFVRQATHSDDLSLSSLVVTGPISANRRSRCSGSARQVSRLGGKRIRRPFPGLIAQTEAMWSCPFCGRAGQRSKEAACVALVLSRPHNMPLLLMRWFDHNVRLPKVSRPVREGCQRPERVTPDR